MLEPTDVRGHPGERVAELVRRLGEAEVVAWCADLLTGEPAVDDPARGLRYVYAPEAAADALVPLVGDDVTRVRADAVCALGVVGEGEHADAVRDAGDDPEQSVRRAAGAALAGMRARLGRDL